MSTSEPRAIASFRQNVEQVYELMEFDKKITSYVLGALETLVKNQKSASRPVPPQFDAAPTLTMIQRVRDNDSLKRHYLDMFNQCVVLLVSHFSSAARQLYEWSVARAYEGMMSDGLYDEKLEVTVGDLSLTDAEDIPAKVGEILASRPGVSFQDMQSIGRAFKTHLEYQPPRDVHVNNIIIAQACRHCLVHDGGEVDERLLKQIAQCKDRTIRVSLQRAETIRFSPEDIRELGSSMLYYLTTTHAGVQAAANGPNWAEDNLL